ncbi:MAG: glutaredoxin 3 [Usitatibacteraceae bacterium]
MPKVTVFLTASCPYCHMAERLLAAKGVTDIDKIRVDLDPAKRQEMMAKTGRRTVPQIYIGDHHVGGFDDLSALDKAGELDDLLAT